MNYMIMPLKRYFDFQGRSRRKEYWMFVLFIIIVTLILSIVFPGTTTTMSQSDAGSFYYGTSTTASVPVDLFFLAIIIPALAVQVRRFHDQDKSGWMCLIGIIPLIGSIIVFVFMVLEGTKGSNRYGPDPKGDNLSDVFS